MGKEKCWSEVPGLRAAKSFLLQNRRIKQELISLRCSAHWPQSSKALNIKHGLENAIGNNLSTKYPAGSSSK